MKSFSFLVLLTVLFVSDYAFAQVPSCPCDDLQLNNGLTGNEIVDILCPGGELGEDTSFLLDADTVSIGNESLFYGVFDQDPPLEDVCIFAEGNNDVNGFSLTEQQIEDCRQRLIQGCNLNRISPIPTLSQWGMIAMAGVLGVIGLIVAARRRKAAV